MLRRLMLLVAAGKSAADVTKAFGKRTRELALIKIETEDAREKCFMVCWLDGL
jgi:hypothetical protein